MSTTLRLAKHQYLPNTSIIEILKDGQVCAVIYPEGDADIKIVSAHFAGDLAEGSKFPIGIRMNNGERDHPPIPSLHVRFDPRPYSIEPGRLVRHKTR